MPSWTRVCALGILSALGARTIVAQGAATTGARPLARRDTVPTPVCDSVYTGSRRLTACGDSVSRRPTDTQAQALLATEYLRQGNWNKSLLGFSIIAAQQAAHDTSGQWASAQVDTLRIDALLAAVKGDTTTAFRLINVGAFHGDTALGSLLAARMRRTNNNDTAAVASYRVAVQARPEDPIPWLELGDLYRIRNKPSDAFAAYRHATEYAEGDSVYRARAWAGMGYTSWVLGRSSIASFYWTKAFMLDSTYFVRHPDELAAYSQSLKRTGSPPPAVTLPK